MNNSNILFYLLTKVLSKSRNIFCCILYSLITLNINIIFIFKYISISKHIIVNNLSGII